MICPRCHGSGTTAVPIMDEPRADIDPPKCSMCEGWGVIADPEPPESERELREPA